MKGKKSLCGEFYNCYCQNFAVFVFLQKLWMDLINGQVVLWSGCSIVKKSHSKISGSVWLTERENKLKAGFHMIADNDRRLQRELFPYNHRQLKAIAEPTVAYILDSGSVNMTRKLC